MNKREALRKVEEAIEILGGIDLDGFGDFEIGCLLGQVEDNLEQIKEDMRFEIMDEE